jgi:hypothetical protein
LKEGDLERQARRVRRLGEILGLEIQETYVERQEASRCRRLGGWPGGEKSSRVRRPRKTGVKER